MGQKINPIVMRLGINRAHDSRWFSQKGFATQLEEDFALRAYIFEKIGDTAGVSRVVIERLTKRVVVSIYAGRPGVIIGKKGADIESLRKDLQKLTKDEVSVNIIEIRKPEIDAKLVAENIAKQLENRVAFRRAMKRAVQNAMRLGALGIRINCSGRLGGAEIARMEWYREGRVPLHTLRADIDFARARAETTMGICGVKVWIFKGEIMENDPLASEKRNPDVRPAAA